MYVDCSIHSKTVLVMSSMLVFDRRSSSNSWRCCRGHVVHRLLILVAVVSFLLYVGMVGSEGCVMEGWWGVFILRQLGH